jgi:hypothetical protein
LSAGVFNTLDSDDDRNLLLNPYGNGEDATSLMFDTTNSGKQTVPLRELAHIIEDETLGINDVKDTKAALFWSAPDRGIYTRAARSSGIQVIKALTSIDRERLRHGLDNLLHTIYLQNDELQRTEDIFGVAAAQLSEHSELNDYWEGLIGELFSIVNKSVLQQAAEDRPAVWQRIQKDIRTLPEAGARTEREKEKVIHHPERSIDKRFGDIVVDPPEIKPSRPRPGGRPRLMDQEELAARDARNKELGRHGEEFVWEFEKASLRHAGKPELATRVVWASEEIGDGLGYDIISYDADGREIYIEVKTTTGGKATPFYLSAREIVTSQQIGPAYRLYRVFNFKTAPKLFKVAGALEQILQLEPISFRARIKPKNGDEL